MTVSMLSTLRYYYWDRPLGPTLEKSGVVAYSNFGMQATCGPFPIQP